MDATKFSRIAEPLRQYRRAELKDFETDVAAADPLDAQPPRSSLHNEATTTSLVTMKSRGMPAQTFITLRKKTRPSDSSTFWLF
jgi:hypothetical protein